MIIWIVLGSIHVLGMIVAFLWLYNVAPLNQHSTVNDVVAMFGLPLLWELIAIPYLVDRLSTCLMDFIKQRDYRKRPDNR